MENTAVMDLIKKEFPDRSGKLYCKFLWSADGIARYRINWTTQQHEMLYSSFVHVDEIEGTVKEVRFEKFQLN